MNRPSLLHIIERLEGFLGKLPASIQKPVLQELTPLKELFLQQRAPRFVLTGSNQLTVHEVVSALFGWSAPRESRDILMELFRWQSIDLGGHGSINLLDARGAEARNIPDIGDELVREPADVFIHLGSDTERTPSDDISNLELFLASNGAARTEAGIIGVVIHDASHSSRVVHNGETHPLEKVDPRSKLQRALQEKLEIRKRLLQVCELSFTPDGPTGSETSTERQRFMGLAARAVPNEARVEMVRISRDKEAQVEISQMLVKSTTAICAAVGAQPIPLADLPILAALQLAMVSGIMYISGRERSLRAATEFLGALGINVGAGMLLREGTRALLKFFPGWGNVVCGMVAGAGTYAIGRATIVYFLEGVTLKEARRTYLTSRKKRAQRQPARIKEVETAP